MRKIACFGAKEEFERTFKDKKDPETVYVYVYSRRQIIYGNFDGYITMWEDEIFRPLTDALIATFNQERKKWNHS